MGQPTIAETADAGDAPCADTVLLVEDSPTDRRLITELLVEGGMSPGTVLCAASLAEARSILTEATVDCILLDLSLPDATGLEGVSVMATAAPDTPIVVVTGRSLDSLVYAAMAEGADEYLCKDDLDPASLSDLLRRAAQRRRGSDRARHARIAASQAFDSLEAQTATLDGSGRIVAVNQAWIRAAEQAGAGSTTTGVGVNYLKVCDLAAGAFADGAADAAAGIRAVLAGDQDRFAMDYWCPSNGVDRWFSVRVTPLGEAGGGAVVTHLDISELKLAEQRLQRDEARLLTVFDESSPIFALLGADGAVHHASQATFDLLGLKADAGSGTGRGTTALACIDREDRQIAIECFQRVVAVPGMRDQFQVTVVDLTGRRRQLDIALVNLLHDPAVGAIAVTGSDVTEGRLHQIARRLESRMLRRLPAAVMVTDDRGVIVYWNDLATKIYGYSTEEAIGRSIAELGIGPGRTAAIDDIVRSVLSMGRWEGEHDAHRADGSTVPVHLVMERVDDEDIAFHGIVGASIDITERRRLEDDLAFQALHDPLTGLPNRRLFLDHLENAIARTSRTGSRAAVLFIDLDDFKSINDRFGHAGGDEVLRTVGELIQAVLREGDLVARLGGDEFVVCFDDLPDAEKAHLVSERITKALAAPFRAGDESVVLSASMGLAVSGPQSPAGELLRNADAAMYVAKESGKSRVEVFDDALHQSGRRRRELDAELQRALADGEIEAHFQPQVALGTGELEGFEALARWTHPERGMVSPAEFIPVAEETGLVSVLGAKILRDACRALAQWLRARPERPIHAAVNVSARQLGDPGFVEMVRETIDECAVPAEHVCLEVTESALIDADLAATVLQELKAIGVKIAIDDFGTGYSSLSRLRRFPVDYLKIDRSFIAGMTCQAEDAAIVSAVLGLARVLGFRTIAEGIEEPTQLEHLTEMGCDSGQGFLWNGALTPADAAAMAAMAEPLPRPPAKGVVEAGGIPASPRSQVPPDDSHACVLYDDDDDLITSVSGSFEAEVPDGAVLVVATPEHRLALEGRWLAAGGSREHFHAHDAGAMLESLLRGGELDMDFFRDNVATIVQDLAQRRPLAIYGEMVNLLWQRGDPLRAMYLEEAWNDLAAQAEFRLICGYRVDPEPWDATLDLVIALHTSAVCLPAEVTTASSGGSAARPVA